MNRTSRQLALAAAALIALGPLSSLGMGAAQAAPIGPVTISPARGGSADNSSLSTQAACKDGETVEVLVSGGTGAGATVPAPGKVLNPPVPVKDVLDAGGMNIPTSKSWAEWATTGTPVLTALSGTYTVAVRCSNGAEFTGELTFTGKSIADAVYEAVTPTPTTATATATETKTATATATATETKTSTATTTATATTTESPKEPTLPPVAPKDGGLVVIGTPAPGAVVKVEASGFKVGSPVVVGIYSEPVKLGTAVANDNGKATVEVTLPADLAGEHTVAMVGINAADTPIARTAQVMLEGPAPAPQSSGIPWWVWLLLGIAAIAIIAGIWGASASKKRRLTEWDSQLAEQATAASRLSDDVALRVSDRGVPAAQVAASLGADMPSLQAAEQKLSALVQSAPDAERRTRAQGLLGASVALREALSADVQLRAGEGAPGQDALLGQSAALVSQRRQELANAIAAVPQVPASHRR